MNIMKGVGLRLTHAGIICPPPQFTPSTPKSSGPSPKFNVKASHSNSNNDTTEVRICVNRTCRRQGSMDVFQILQGIAPPTVTVNSCGCLGRCGAGPNLVILPGPNFVGHCGTAARAADVMAYVCCGGDSGWGKKSLEALVLRQKAEDEMRKGNFSQAELLLTQALDLKPFGGIHIIYKDRCAARLMRSNIAEALEDSKEALALAPSYPEAWICQGDAFLAMEQFDAAENYYSMALELDPSIRRSKSFKARIAKLQEKTLLFKLCLNFPNRSCT